MSAPELCPIEDLIMFFLFRPEQDERRSSFSADELKRKLKKLKDSAPMKEYADQQDQNKVFTSH